MKLLFTLVIVLIYLNSNAQLKIKVRFQKDGVYWNSLEDNSPKYARLKFDTVTLEKRIETHNNIYWMFRSDGAEYYTTDGMLYPSIEIDSIENKVKIDKENEYKAHRKKLSEQRHQYLIKKYGNEYGNLIYNGNVRIGMTKAMAIGSWGKPKEIHKTILSNYVSEQWVYEGGNYLYFTNDKLTAIQN